jgi:hypothetical protein
MSANFTKVLTEEPKLKGPVYRYGALVFWAALTLLSVIVFFHLPAGKPGRYFGVICPPTLLLSHLAYQFRWPVPITAALRVLVLLGCIAVVGYTLMFALGKG